MVVSSYTQKIALFTYRKRAELNKSLQTRRTEKFPAITLIEAIPKCFHTNTQSKVSQKHNNLILKYVNKAPSFNLQSHHQAILNHIIIGILSGSAHLWDPKMFKLINIVGIKKIAAIKYVNM